MTMMTTTTMMMSAISRPNFHEHLANTISPVGRIYSTSTTIRFATCFSIHKEKKKEIHGPSTSSVHFANFHDFRSCSLSTGDSSPPRADDDGVENDKDDKLAIL